MVEVTALNVEVVAAHLRMAESSGSRDTEDTSFDTMLSMHVCQT